MIAIDTNVVVRYLTNDHPRQSGAARTPISENAVFLSRTVILECEWVLRGVYGFSPPEVCKALRAFAGLPKISIEDLGMVVRALDLAGHGFRRRTSPGRRRTLRGLCYIRPGFRQARKAGRPRQSPLTLA